MIPFLPCHNSKCLVCRSEYHLWGERRAFIVVHIFLDSILIYVYHIDEHTSLAFWQTEIDTHLHVLHVSVNQNYDSAANTEEALDTMSSIYSRTSWHYTSREGIQPDLHHALLRKNLGGGRAMLGVICSPEFGFGVSSGISGTYQSMSQAVVWDMSLVSVADEDVKPQCLCLTLSTFLLINHPLLFSVHAWAWTQLWVWSYPWWLQSCSRYLWNKLSCSTPSS